MHEWALAEAIVREVENIVSKHPGLKKIKVVAGELQNIDENTLRHYLNLMMSEVAPLVKYEIEREEAVFKCNACGHTWTLSEGQLSDYEREAIHFVPEAVHAYLKCPRCGSRDYMVIKGRGVKLVYEVNEG